jgi:starch phosphorylase
MKAALNGVPQLSTLDGWWIEGYHGQNGWAIEHQEHESDRDGLDAEAIYRLLEHEIIPIYYSASDDGIPVEWVKLMKATIKASAARFSARRMVKDYVDNLYVPALGQTQPHK